MMFERTAPFVSCDSSDSIIINKSPFQRTVERYEIFSITLCDAITESYRCAGCLVPQVRR